MSLSSLQSAFSGGDYLVSTFGGGRGGAFRIHGTLRHRNKNAGRCQSLFVSRAGLYPAQGELDAADLLIYGAASSLTGKILTDKTKR
jgi:hypothetical protein